MIDELGITSEEDIDLASEDFFEPEGRPPLKPGRYLSKARELTSKNTRKGDPAVGVKFEKFQTLKGEDVQPFPPFENLYFHKQKSWNGEGEISSVGRYLKACGLPFNGLSPEELKANLNASQSIPVVVVVGWEQDYKEVAAYGQQDGDPKPKAKRTNFFKNQDGTFTHQKMVDGRVYTARAKVTGYEKFTG